MAAHGRLATAPGTTFTHVVNRECVPWPLATLCCGLKDEHADAWLPCMLLTLPGVERVINWYPVTVGIVSASIGPGALCC
jgi:hypothetical protein